MRNCLLCQSPLEGRRDKKFCDDYCRNIHYHQNLGSGIDKVRRIQDMLRKNRKILLECMGLIEAGKTIRLESLKQRGYQFKFLTHMEWARDQEPAYCCFDLGYRLTDTKDNSVEIFRVDLPE